MPHKLLLAPICLTLACSAGCRVPLSAMVQPPPSADKRPLLDGKPAGQLAAAPVEPAPIASAPIQPNPQSLEQAVAQLEAAGKLDPQARQQLLADLQKTDPALWPQYLAVFRSALAYRDQRRAELADGGVPVAPVAHTMTGPAPIALPASGTLRSPHVPGPAVVAPAPTPQVPYSQAPITQALPPFRSAAVVTPVAAPATALPTAAPGNVQQVAFRPGDVATPNAWQAHLDQAIRQLETDVRESPDTDRESRLRLLYLVAGRRDEALRSSPAFNAEGQAFWTSQLYALASYLQSQPAGTTGHRTAEAAEHLRNAAAKLGEMGQLAVRNLHFCTEVTSYGVFKPFGDYQFQPGQELLLYAEIENFKSESREGGHYTALAASYRLIDAQGREAAQGNLGRTEEQCRNVRRDYFVRYFLSVPAHLYDGKYTLQLTLEDELAKKAAQSTIELTIARATAAQAAVAR